MSTQKPGLKDGCGLKVLGGLIQPAGPEPQNHSQKVSKEGATSEGQPLRDILLKRSFFFNSERNRPNEIQSIKKWSNSQMEKLYLKKKNWQWAFTLLKYQTVPKTRKLLPRTSREPKTILKNKNKVEVTFSDFKTYYKTMVIETLRYSQKDRFIDPWNNREPGNKPSPYAVNMTISEAANSI